MKEIKIFNENGMINKTLKPGNYVCYSYDLETPSHIEHISDKGIIISVKKDTKYNDRECDEYIVETSNGTHQEIYGRDIDEAFV